MHQIDLPLQNNHLRQLGDDFTAQQRALQRLKPEPGTELLRQLAPAIPAAHELITQFLLRLAVLGDSHRCSPWACCGESEPVQDDFGLAS